MALVFSIFDLNPAPFCLLDEVDAPLDEHNVGRFCDIVRDMSSRVQFIFITHNKVTMELASQLVGVTMNEPGVSRLVAVDIDEAVKLAAVWRSHHGGTALDPAVGRAGVSGGAGGLGVAQAAAGGARQRDPAALVAQRARVRLDTDSASEPAGKPAAPAARMRRR